jgi:hypothetical protein
LSLQIISEEESDQFQPKRYGIVGLIGNREGGKSTFMVRKLVKEGFSHQHYKKIFCNLHVGAEIRNGVHVGPPNVQHITYEDFMKIKEPAPNGIPTALVGVDQIHRWFDSRKSGSNHNIETSDKIIQSRQNGFDLITTTWAKSFVDLRLRRFYELLIDVKKSRHAMHYAYVDPDSGLVVAKKKLTVQQAKETWKYFDTAEEVPIPRDLLEIKEKRKK